jgi:glycosyltransferase involved in cell wall biosynthesis
MAATGKNLPIGFHGPVRGWESLVPAAKNTLHLPKEMSQWCAGQSDAADRDLIEVTALTESMGRVEDLFTKIAGQLADGGVFLCDFDNLQSARQLRLVIEGRPGSFDPADSSRDPSQALLLRRALAAASAAGLLIRDVIRVTSPSEGFGQDLPKQLFGAGLMPIDWICGAPPSRFWLQCEKVPSLAGSVVLAGGDADSRAKTERALRAFLPADWEIVTSDAIGECAQWNRGIVASRGDVIWFVRAGMEPTVEAFQAMSPRADIGVVRASCSAEQGSAGDVAGMMLPRLDALLVGPLPEQLSNTLVALEEYAMMLDSKLPPAQLVDVEVIAPKVPVESPATIEAETRCMLKRWSAVEESKHVRSASDALAETAQLAAWSGRAPRITLCMIARDEEEFLGECLQHAQGAFDEFILVDTGSKDRTVEIAESFGAQVLHQPWEDNFSKPRNLGLQAATGDWILVLDADEHIVSGGCKQIRQLVKDPRALGYHMLFTNQHGDGKTAGVMMVRLFRNLPGIEYKNIIHEQVTPSLQRIGGPMGLELLSTDVEVEHFGYTDELMVDRSKNERNERLFQKDLAERPDDIYLHYKYGDFLRRVPSRTEDAKRLLDRCLELILASEPSLPRSLPYAAEVAALCALEAERAGESQRAREVLDIGLRRFVPTPNLHYLTASLANADGDSETAILHYRRCMAYRGRALVVPIQDGITSYVSLTGIAQAWLHRGDRARAKRLLEQVTAIEPSYEVAFLLMSRIYLEAQEFQPALNVLTDFLADHPDSPGACQQAMLILHRIGQKEAARKIGKHAVRLLEARCLERQASELNEILIKI